jgi:hypothetical protein
MSQDHYIYVVFSECRDEPTSEGVNQCKAYRVDICGVRGTYEAAKECAQADNTDDDDNPIPLGPWSGFWDGRSTARGAHDDFTIVRTYNHPFPFLGEN